MNTDNNRIIYVRGKGFLTESGEWSSDIVDAMLFPEDGAKICAAGIAQCKPVILTWN